MYELFMSSEKTEDGNYILEWEAFKDEYEKWLDQFKFPEEE
jgi:hypothetical protein